MVSKLAPGPLIVMLAVMLGRAVVRSIVPVTPVASIKSAPPLLPAAHSPAVAPEAVSVFAAIIASRNVHNPSLPLATSAVLFTTIVLAAGLIPPLSRRNELAETAARAARAGALAF
jgi:hypothetical protein